MGYYDEKQYLAGVDTDDTITGKVEKWEAHKNSILHRGYTVILTHGEDIILQHRKHPVFDDVFDLSFSSHQIYRNGVLQSDEEAIYEGLTREWGMGKEDIAGPLRFIRKIYYQEKDPKSEYSEHEIDYIYQVEVLRTPDAVSEFAYGLQVVKKTKIITGEVMLSSPFAPWVKIFLAKRVI